MSDEKPTRRGRLRDAVAELSAEEKAEIELGDGFTHAAAGGLLVAHRATSAPSWDSTISR